MLLNEDWQGEVTKSLEEAKFLQGASRTSA